MALSGDLAGEPNDMLLLNLLHVTGLGPLYARRPSGHDLPLTSVVVFIDQGHWPLPEELQAVALTWTAAKFGIRQDRVSLCEMPEGGLL